MTRPVAGSVSGTYAGPVTRLAGFGVDAFTVSAMFGLLANLVAYFAQTILGIDLTVESDRTGWWLVAYVVWTGGFLWVSLAITGRTPGMWLAGLRVLSRDGSPLGPTAAFVRTVTLPLSFVVLGLGFLGVVVGKRRRALHDVLAGSVVVYDWGDRHAEMPGPLTNWLESRGAIGLPEE